jgi:hypothetical protein
MEITDKWCKEVLEEAKNDPSLLSTIDIDAIINKIDKDGGSYLENKTLANISKEIFEAIKSIDIPDHNSIKIIVHVYQDIDLLIKYVIYVMGG